MNAGITYAKAWNLIPGVGLTAAQMAQLTSDLVWLVEQEVTLADGSTQKVLAPQLYARIKEGDLGPAGGLLADNTLDLSVSGNLDNLGTLAGRQLVALSAENLNNLGGRITGEEVWLTARQDIHNRGGQIDAGQRLDLAAGRNITIESTTSSEGGRTNIDRIASLYVNNPGGTLQLAANGDISLLAAYLINNAPTAAGPASRGDGSSEGEQAAPAASTTRIAAGKQLTLGTVTTAYAEAVGDGKHARQESGSNETGSTIETTGDITLSAGSDLSARAANVSSAQGQLLARAGQDLRIEAGESTLNTAEQHKTKSKGFLSSSKTTTRDTSSDTTAIASTFSGDSVTLVADRDIAVKGSNVVATNDATLIATRNLSIEAASETHNETHFSKTKQSGVFSSGGVGFTIGSKQNSTDQQTDASTAAKSTIGSTDGNVLLLAGEKYKQVGSDVIAVKGDIDIAAKQVDIVEARETSKTVTEQKSKQSGLTIAITSPIITAIQTAQQMSEAAADTKDGRMKLLAAANVGLAANNAASAIAESGSAVGGVNLTISIGGSKSSSKSTQTSDNAAASNLSAGRDIRIEASGAGAESDLTIQGSKAAATRNLTLAAEDEIRLLAAQNTADQKSSNKNSSASVGISIGSNTGVVLGASAGRGKADGEDVVHTNTHVEAGETLTLQSGGDTTLKGAVAKGEKVIADIKGDLAIESLQDTSVYKSKQQSLGGSVTIGTGGVTGSVSASNSKIESDYASVSEQSAIRAGDSGFQVDVKNDTDLKAGAITSTQQAIDDQLNHFQTGGKLTTSDIQNKAEYNAKSASVNVGTSLSFDGALKPGGTSAGFGQDGDKAESMTLAAISGIAGNQDARTGDKETGIGKIFDQEKVQQEIDAQVRITQMFGQLAPKAAADFAKTRQDALNEQAKLENDPTKKTELQNEAKQWGEGGAYRVALHTALGGLAGGAQGALGAGASAAAAPLLNELQDGIAKSLKDAGANDNVAKLAGQLISGATAAGVGAAVGGTQGAMTAFNTDANNRQLHPTEKQLAKRLAAQSKGKYTAEQIEDALRWADNKELNESRFSNIVVPLNTDTEAGQIFDAASMSFSANGGNPVLYQDMSKLAVPSADLMAYVQQQTGDIYQWNTSVWKAAPTQLPTDATRYTLVAVPKPGGQDGVDYLSIPLANCPAAGCTNGSPIAWATTNPEDQKALATYAASLDQQAKRAVAIGAGPLVMGAGAAWGGIPLASQFITGSLIGTGVNAGAQYVLNDGNIKPTEVVMGGLTGGLTMGRDIIPTVLINTGGAMITSGYGNDSIGASMLGTALGSALGWKVGSVTERSVGKVIQRTTTDFSSEWTSAPFAISAPIPVSQWPARLGATTGGFVQEFSGDYVKNAGKEKQ